MSKTKVFKCHHCGHNINNEKELVIKPVPLSTKSGIRNYKRKFHFDCMKEYLDTLDSKEVLSEENSWWEKCYEKAKDWLGISAGQNLDQHFVMRLKGLRVGKYLPNGDNTHIVKRGYDFETIYRTMQLSDSAVRKALAERSYSNQQHKINYVMIIVVKNINFVYSKMNAQRKSKERLESSVSKDDIVHKEFKYVRKTKTEEVSNVSRLIEETLEDNLFDEDDLF